MNQVFNVIGFRLYIFMQHYARFEYIKKHQYLTITLLRTGSLSSGKIRNSNLLFRLPIVLCQHAVIIFASMKYSWSFTYNRIYKSNNVEKNVCSIWHTLLCSQWTLNQFHFVPSFPFLQRSISVCAVDISMPFFVHLKLPSKWFQ